MFCLSNKVCLSIGRERDSMAETFFCLGKRLFLSTAMGEIARCGVKKVYREPYVSYVDHGGQMV